MKKIMISLMIALSSGITGCFYLPVQSHSVVFETKPCIHPNSGYRYFTCHDIDVLVDGRLVTIPEAFDTDLASVPRWLWVIIAPSHSALMGASILHDYLYSCPGTVTRQEADSIFYQALVENGVSKFAAYRMYLAVRICGFMFYKTGNKCVVHRKEEVPLSSPFVKNLLHNIQ